MSPGIVRQTPASTTQSPNAAGCQSPPDHAELFDTALEAAFGPASGDEPIDADATVAAAEEPRAAADPSALAAWWLALAGGAPALSDGAATIDVSTSAGSPAENEDTPEEEGSGSEDLESSPNVSNVLVVALVPQPLDLQSTTDSSNVLPDEASDDLSAAEAAQCA